MMIDVYVVKHQSTAEKCERVASNVEDLAIQLSLSHAWWENNFLYFTSV